MLKQAWRSYLTSLHPRNYKKIKDTTGSFFWIYWMIIMPTLNDFDHSGEAGRQIWFYIANLTPYFLMWWSNLGQKLAMPKLMYLLPMKKPEQAKYISSLMLIKILFPGMIGFVLHMIRGMIYELELYRIMLCTIAVFSFGIGMYVCSSLRSKFDRHIRYAVRGEDGNGKDAVLNWTCMIYAVIFHFFASAVEINIAPDESLLGRFIILGLPVLIMVVMDIAIIKTRFLWTVVDTCDYEENFNILGKVK